MFAYHPIRAPYLSLYKRTTVRIRNSRSEHEKIRVFTITHICRSLEEITSILNDPSTQAARRRSQSVLVQIMLPPIPHQAIQLVTDQIRSAIPEASIQGVTVPEFTAFGSIQRGKTCLSLHFFDATAIRTVILPTLPTSIPHNLLTSSSKLILLTAALPCDDVCTIPDKILRKLPYFTTVCGASISHTVFDSQHSTSQGILLVIFDNDSLNVSIHSHLGWIPLGRTFTVTKAHQNILYELNEEPAWKVYNQYLGLDDTHPLVDMGRQFPLVKLDTEGKPYAARLPLAKTSEGAIILGGDLKEGDKVRISYGDVHSVLHSGQSIYENILEHSPQGIFTFYSHPRYRFLQNSAHLELQSLQAIANTVGFCAQAELIKNGRSCMLHNNTLTIVTLREQTPTISTPPGLSAKPHFIPNQADTVEVPVAAMGALSHFINAVTRELEESNLQLERLATCDPLTGVFNRREFFRRGNLELQRFQRKGTPFCIILMDLDHFKQINDTYGHAAGDAALKTFARVCRHSIRELDIPARIGGEEFVILLPDTELAEAIAVAERICNKIRSQPIQVPKESSNQQDFRITVSAGITYIKPEDHTLDSTLARADKLLYQAKEQGRDRVLYDT